MAIHLNYLETIHEKEIVEYFKPENILLRREKFNKTKLGVFIIFSNRSGSNLLGEYLGQHPNLKEPREILNYPQVIRLSTENKYKKFERYFRKMIKEFSVNGYFITKLDPYQFSFLLKYDLLSRNFRSVKVIIIKREDLLKQAISHHIASQTDEWQSNPADNQVEIIYDEAKLLHIMRRFNTLNGYANLLVQLLNLDAYHLTYEDFIQNKIQHCMEIFKFLDMPASGNLYDGFNPRHEKQIMPEKMLFYERFREKYSLHAIHTKEISLISEPEEGLYPKN